MDGFLGEQFALPEALEALRLTRRTSLQDSFLAVSVSATDPLEFSRNCDPWRARQRAVGSAGGGTGRSRSEVRCRTLVSGFRCPVELSKNLLRWLGARSEVVVIRASVVE